MSKRSKDNLFELIKSLTKSEKRYFKLLSSRHTIGDENNYIVLFDYLDKIDAYDEDALFDHFKGEAFLNRFSITKKRLYDHLLSALDTYYSNSSLDAQLYKSLHSADILYNKSLYDQCRRVLMSAQKLALKNERFAILMEISKRQKKLVESNGYSDVKDHEIAEMIANDLIYLQALQENATLWNLKSELFIELSRKGVTRNEGQRETFEKIINELKNSVSVNALTVGNLYLYNHIYSAYYFAIREYEECLVGLKNNIALFDENPNYLQEHPNSYFSVLTNAIYVSEKLGEFQFAKLLLQDLKQFPVKYSAALSEDLQIKLFSSTSSIELSSYIARGDFDAAKKLIPIIQDGLRLYGEKIPPQRKAFLEFKFASIYLATQDFSEALKWVNSILNDSRLDSNEDILAFTHLLDLIIHLELKHDKLIPYAIKSTERFLKSRNILHSFEKVMLRFITKLLKAKDVFENETIWKELQLELAELKQDAQQNVGLDYFDFESWAASKVKRKKFDDVVRENFKQLARA